VPEVRDADVLDWEFSVEGYGNEASITPTLVLMPFQAGQGTLYVEP
jgi:hypothetical protein